MFSRRWVTLVPPKKRILSYSENLGWFLNSYFFLMQFSPQGQTRGVLEYLSLLTHHAWSLPVHTCRSQLGFLHSPLQCSKAGIQMLLLQFHSLSPAFDYLPDLTRVISRRHCSNYGTFWLPFMKALTGTIKH